MTVKKFSLKQYKMEFLATKVSGTIHFAHFCVSEIIPSLGDVVINDNNLQFSGIEKSAKQRLKINIRRRK